MSNHDANEERRYIKSWKRTHLTWGWMWFSWSFGPSCLYEPEPYQESWSIGFSLGPFVIELYRERLRVSGS